MSYNGKLRRLAYRSISRPVNKVSLRNLARKWPGNRSLEWRERHRNGRNQDCSQNPVALVGQKHQRLGQLQKKEVFVTPVCRWNPFERPNGETLGLSRDLNRKPLVQVKKKMTSSENRQRTLWETC